MFNPYDNLGGNFINKTFADVFNTVDVFVTEYKTSGVYSDVSKITDNSAELLYYLLYQSVLYCPAYLIPPGAETNQRLF